jgi:hypothetical protein
MKKSNKDNSGAVLYLRVASADRQDQREGIAQQREACIREAERLGAVITGEYVDAGARLVSADNSAGDRPPAPKKPVRGAR